jgi:DNA (cytosine-5)-methyltransferase 1
MKPFALYNEIEPFLVSWLNSLALSRRIAEGVVNSRSIRDLTPDDVVSFTQAHFFAGIGCWSYALKLAGWPDDRPIWTGSCPCQPFSSTGRGAGFEDPRHLWPVWFTLIRKCRPSVVVGEQVASPAGLVWLDSVFDDWEREGYACGAADLCAAGIGAPHARQRLYWLAYTDEARRGRVTQSHVYTSDELEASRRLDVDRCSGSAWATAREVEGADGSWRLLAPGVVTVVDGTAPRMGNLRAAYGNAIVVPLAAEFMQTVMDLLE